MEPDSGQTTSIWMDRASVPNYPALAHDADTRVCVVGAGIAGLTTAYLLSKQGQNVIVPDEGLESARRAGVEVEAVDRAPFAMFETGPCLRFPNQARFHPLAYLSALAAEVVRAGGRIFCGTHVSNTESKDGRVTVTIEKP